MQSYFFNIYVEINHCYYIFILTAISIQEMGGIGAMQSYLHKKSFYLALYYLFIELCYC